MESIHPQHDRDDDDVKKKNSEQQRKSKMSPISFSVLIFAGKNVCRVTTCFGVVLLVFLRPTNEALTTSTLTHSCVVCVADLLIFCVVGFDDDEDENEEEEK